MIPLVIGSGRQAESFLLPVPPPFEYNKNKRSQTHVPIREGEPHAHRQAHGSICRNHLPRHRRPPYAAHHLRPRRQRRHRPGILHDVPGATNVPRGRDPGVPTGGEDGVRPNKLTEGSNLLWESSRIILPEHKERIRILREEARRGGKRERPQLDEQEWERIQEAVARSLHERVPVRLRMYDPLEDLVVEGIVEQVDPVRRRIRVDGEWFEIADIIGV